MMDVNAPSWLNCLLCARWQLGQGHRLESTIKLGIPHLCNICASSDCTVGVHGSSNQLNCPAMADSDSVENGKPLNVPDSQNSPRSRGDSVVGDSAGTSRRPTSSGYQLAARSSLSSSLSIHESATVEAAVQGSSETFFFSASDVQPKFEVGWRRAASGYFDENLLEQKMWIQCTLKGAKQRGEDWIDSKFIDDKHANSGCTACLPDIVVVNDPAIKESSDAFKSRISAPWQRVWTRDEADAQTKRTYKTPPPVANSMLSRFSPEYPDTYLYDQKRFVCYPFFSRHPTEFTLQVVLLVSAMLCLCLHEPDL